MTIDDEDVPTGVLLEEGGWWRPPRIDNFRCYTFMDENRLTIQLVLLIVSVWAMWLFIDVCVPCIFVVTLVSAFFCFEYRLMNIVLWASVIVLWGHGWSFGDRSNGLSMSWK